MTEVDHSPTRLGGRIALAAALIATVAGGAYSWAALGAGAVGLLLVAAGVLLGVGAAVTLGAASLFGGVIVAGVGGAPAPAVLIGTVASVVAWDVGDNAVVLGAQLGRAAPTARVEAIHATATVLVGALTAGVGYGVFRAAGGGQPVTALALLLLAAFLLASAFR